MNLNKKLDLDKALERAKKSRKKRQGKVEAKKMKEMGKNAYHRMQLEEADKKVSAEKAVKMNAVIRDLNARIEDTKEGSREEEELLKRRNRLMKKQGRY